MTEIPPDTAPNPATDSALTGALRRVLGPIARLMLARGMTLPLAVELLKRVFVETARRDFRLDAKSVTDSRITLLTGVHRKDVKRLRQLPTVGAALTNKVSLGLQLIGRWGTQAPWVEADGTPKPLPRLFSQGGECSFDALVASVSRDIRPRSVLDEWVRSGVVSVNEIDQVILNTPAFVSKAGIEEKLDYLGINLGDHAQTACSNVLGDGPSHFERSVQREGLTAEQVASLQKRATELGMSMLKTLHAEAEAMKAVSGDGDQRWRFTCGIYWFDGQSLTPESAEQQ